MNVFSFVQWNKNFHLVKYEMYHSTRLASLNGPFHLGFALFNETVNLSPYENICTIALINIYYLYNKEKNTQLQAC